jgi:hypothetical protein
MGKKKGAPRWVRLFLRALGACANVRVAADAAGVDHSTAYNRRKRHSGFAEAWEAAAAEGRERVAEAERVASPLHQPSPAATAGPPPCAGEELVFRASARAGTQLVRAGRGRWSVGAERAFLTELGRTACVQWAADAAGFSTTALYKRRGRYPDFAERWRATEEEAKGRLHGFLVQAGLASFDAEARARAEAAGLPRVSVGEAIAILRLKGGAGPGGAGFGASPNASGRSPSGYEEPSIEEVRDEVLRRLAAMRRRRDGEERR